MNWGRLRSSGNENVFRGSQLVSSLLERNPQRFRSRAAALKYSRQLFNDGVIRGVFGADTFEDSVQLYTWTDKYDAEMMSYSSPPIRQAYQVSGHDVKLTRRDVQQSDQKVLEDVRHKFSSQSIKQTRDYHYKGEEKRLQDRTEPRSSKQILSYQTSWNLQRSSTASSESSVEAVHHFAPKTRDKQNIKSSYPSHTHTMHHPRDHDVIPEEGQEEQMADRSSNSLDFDGSSIPRSTTTVSTPFQYEDSTPPRRWQDFQNSYSDNEKQLIEQMKRMKKEHSHILRTYEDRINKLMAKMHELRSIAEMLENSSSKSSPYGTCLVPSKGGILGYLGSRLDQDRRQTATTSGLEQEQPPPLPPRPGKGSRLYPNKPIVQTQAKMTTLPWTRVILKDDGKDEQTTIWHTMMEPKLDNEEVERLFRIPEVSPTDGATLYDDLIIRRGRSRYQLVSIYDSDRSKRIVECMRCLRATLTEVIATVSSVDTSQINQDSLADLLELMASVADIEKILYHVKKKGAGQLDHPEYLVFELSKVDHFRDRLEFMRFRYKMQWHLFEIDQQLRELHTACDEIMSSICCGEFILSKIAYLRETANKAVIENKTEEKLKQKYSISLKNLLETLLSVGNYLNGGTDMGQADGYHLDVLNRLKEIRDKDGRGTLLEFVLKTYCQVYENEVDIGCPTRFRLPEPSNMRHASQVSFEGIQDALSNLHADLRHVREKLLDPKVNKNTTRPMDSFRVTAENFFAAALEVIGDQEKVLQDTRDFFDKTVAHFAIDISVTPQQFFQIWAVFLHDCKYFWKLAHRRLAKERFELEFQYKGQTSSCSLHGYGSFQAAVMKGISCGQDIKTSTQLRHVDNWVKVNTLPEVPPKPFRKDTHEDRDLPDQAQRSPSPKPITSTPPSAEDVYKPQPKPPVVSRTSPPIPNGTVPMSPNYENQFDYGRQIPKTNTSNIVGTPHLPVQAKSAVTSTENSKRFQQFSLKAWLKREREQVKRDVESDTVMSNSDSKQQSPSRSLTKFKNSVFQRFGGGSSNKKQVDSPKKTKHNKEFASPPVKPVRQNYVQEISAPYAVVKKEIVSENNVLSVRDFAQDESIPEVFKERGYYNNRGFPEPVISPIDDNEVNGEIETVDNNICSAENENTFGITKSDLNNNENFKLNVNTPDIFKPTDEFASTQIEIKTELSPPAAQNLDDSGAYLGDSELRSHLPHHREEAPDSERLLAQKIPVYKAKIINSRDNQGKFEVIHAVRQHAEPLRGQDTSHKSGRFHEHDRFEKAKHAENTHVPEDQTAFQTPMNSPFTSPQKYTKTDPGPIPSHKVQNRYRGSSRQNIERKRDIGKHGRAYNERDNPYSAASRTRLTDNTRAATPGNKETVNNHSIGPLIDKFDKQNNNPEHTPISAFNSSEGEVVRKEPMIPKPLTMTSTPVAHRKEFSGTLDEIIETSPPLPPRSDKSRHKQSINDNSMVSSSQNNRYRQQEITSWNTSDSYYGSFTQNIQSPVQNPYKLDTPSIHSPADPKVNVSNSFYSPMCHNYGSPNDSGMVNIVNNNLSSGTNAYASNNNANMLNNNERDDNYCVRLRRAANNSAFDRYGQSKTQYQGRIGPYYQSPNSPHVATSGTQNEEGISYMEI